MNKNVHDVRLIFWVLIVGLFCPAAGIAQSSFFDSNGNGYIDDDELLIIINYWAQHKPIPTPTPIVLGNTMIVMLPGDVPLELVKIAAGEGIVNGQTVSVGEFWMGKYEITQAQWKAVMGDNPFKLTGPNRPVEAVSWYECHDFLDALNSLGLGTFSLPSEAQWEYACRAGTTTVYFWGDDSSVARYFAWYHENLGGGTHDVGGRFSNQWGLHDMTG